MRLRSFAVMVVGAILMVGSWVIAYSYFRPAPTPPPYVDYVWDRYYSPAQKTLSWTWFAGAVMFLSGLVLVSINGVKRLWKKGS